MKHLPASRTRADVLLLAVLAVLSFLPLALRPGGAPLRTAVLTVDGEVRREIPLTTHRGRETLTVETDAGSNTVTIDGNTIAVTDADCPDRICVKTGAISRRGEVIACLPHRLLIEIR